MKQPSIGDTIYAVNFDGDRLVPIGTIRDTLHLYDVDENLWQVWYSTDSDHFEYLSGTNWFPSLNAWILDVDHASSLNLI